MKHIAVLFALAFLSATIYAESGANEPAAATSNKPVVRLLTNLGNIDIELDADRAPITVKNFLNYVDKGFYNGLIFHRVISNFMIQGGGFTPDMKEKKTGAPIKNEANNGLKNLTGTIAMARTQDPNSAAAQFFINTRDNSDLNHRSKTVQGWGYAVFGKVIKGMEVVRKIEASPTTRMGYYSDVPVKKIIIKKAIRLNIQNSGKELKDKKK